MPMRQRKEIQEVLLAVTDLDKDIRGLSHGVRGAMWQPEDCLEE